MGVWHGWPLHDCLVVPRSAAGMEGTDVAAVELDQGLSVARRWHGSV